MEMYMGSIIAWPMSWAPRGWMLCHGQLLSISDYSALYSLLGTTYGGDGKTTFALPDLRGRVPVGEGQAHGTPYFQLGAMGGHASVTLTTNEMPMHHHVQPASTKTATVGQPGPSSVPGSYEKDRGVYYNIYSQQSDADTALAPTETAGGNQPHSNMQPFVTLNYIICVEGLYPPRD